MIGYLTGFAADDWTVVLEVCERAAANEANAREAAKALRREFKYAEPSAQMAAARLWAIMLRYSSEVFIAQTTTKKFLEVVEEVCTSNKTTPVVRERLLEVVAGAAYAHPSSGRDGFAGAWRRVKHPSQPEEGIPFDDLDPMFTPPAPKTQRQPPAGYAPQHAPHPSYDRNVYPDGAVRQRNHSGGGGGGGNGGLTTAQQYAAQYGHLPTQQQQQQYAQAQYDAAAVAANGGHAARRREQRMPTAEEEIRTLYDQCEVARNNARLLGEAVIYTKPLELGQSTVIKEFYAKCMASQEFIVAQIQWATAHAERSREKLQEALAIAVSTGEVGPETQPQTETPEELLLGVILAANQELTDAFEQYQELERMRQNELEENEVALRSMTETRLDRTQIQYYSADGSFQLEAPGGVTGAGSSSRSASPAPAHVRPVPPPLTQQNSVASYTQQQPLQHGHTGLPQIATQPPTPAALGQNGPQIHQMPPTPVDLLGSGIVRAGDQHTHQHQHQHQHQQSQTQYAQYTQHRQTPSIQQQQPQPYTQMAPPPPAPMGPRKQQRSRTPSPTRRERGRGSAGGGSERDSSSEDASRNHHHAHLQQQQYHAPGSQQLGTEYPVAPSQKALGKRRAVEGRDEVFRVGGAVFNSSTGTLENTPDDSDDDTPAAVAARAARPKWARQQTSYVYDAADERRKERELQQKQARSVAAVAAIGGIGGSGSGGSAAGAGATSAPTPAPAAAPTGQPARNMPAVSPVQTTNAVTPVGRGDPQTPTPTATLARTGTQGKLTQAAAATSPDKERVRERARANSGKGTLPRPPATVTVVTGRAQ
ncbi:hypothetical protein BKA62DRAFT_830912 [Auriculariales sp. MPI-PUGE-AT-0066]|nr:hypothetical protein BKA62DRAFT_830912 [Auriculariales sp. MPI-PUGE-AT-0066]